MEPLRKVLAKGFDEVLAAIPEALKSEGFGILTEIDVTATMKKKLDVDFRPYRILGACNPPFAKKALDADLEIGRFMPCSIAVYQDDEHRTVVSAVDPIESMKSAGETAAMRELASAVREKLARAVSRIEKRRRRVDLQSIILVAVVVAAWFFMFRYGKTSSAEAHKLVAAGARLVDVRTPGEFSGGALPGAVNIPLGELPARVGELKKEPKPVVVYCASGMRSGQAKRILTGAGIAEVHDLGGMGRW